MICTRIIRAKLQKKLSQKCARKLDLMAGSEREISIGGIEFHSLGIRLK